MKSKCRRNIKRSYRDGLTFTSFWSKINRNSSSFNDDSKNDHFLKEKPEYQILLTDIENICKQPIEYSNYEQSSLDYLKNNHFSNYFSGILNYIYCCSNNKFNIEELEFLYSGSKNRKKLQLMNQNQSKDEYDIMNIFNYEDFEKEFKIGNQKNASFGINFKNIKIRPVSYAIRSGSNSYSNLISFKFEGYDSKSKRWDVLDERENTSELIPPGGFMMYYTKHTDKCYSLFRIQQTSPCHNDLWGFNISGFDIHGNVSNRTDQNEENDILFTETETELEIDNENEKMKSNHFINLCEYVLI